PGLATYLINQSSNAEAVRFLEEINPDDAADIFLTMTKERQEELLAEIGDDDFRKVLIDLVSYPSDSAGGIMTTEYLAVPEDYTAEETIEEAREKSEDAEIIYYIYTLNEDNRLSGALSMRRLLQVDPETPVREIAQRDLIKVRVGDDQEVAANVMDRYGLLSVPVVDHQDRMRGIITVDDAVGIKERETTEDIYKQAGLSPFQDIETERNVQITEADLWTNLALKIPWLVVVFFGTLVTASMVGLFEGYLNKYVELAFFMPVIAAMGGNVGAQSTTIYVRAMVLNKVDLERFWYQFFGEIYRTGIGIGIFFGLFLGLFSWCWQYFLRHKDPTGYALSFSLAVGVAMFLAIVAASANGFFIPWLVQKLGSDPATASNPLLTTVQDIVGILIYFSSAAFFLSFL
ncbi:MAG: magnesium transporter, partial [bacterium]